MGTPLRFPNCPEQCLKNMCCSRRESPSKTSPSPLYFSYIPPNSSQHFRKSNLIYLLSSLVSCSQNRLHSLSHFKLRLEAGSKRNDTFKLNSTQYFTRRRQKLIDQDAKPTPPAQSGYCRMCLVCFMSSSMFSAFGVNPFEAERSSRRDSSLS